MCYFTTASQTLKYIRRITWGLVTYSRSPCPQIPHLCSINLRWKIFKNTRKKIPESSKKQNLNLPGQLFNSACLVFVFCLVPKLCPTLCDPMDCNTPGSSVHGIPQARILEWVAISFSNTMWALSTAKAKGNIQDEMEDRRQRDKEK